jgi:thymidine kinase
MSNSGKLTTIVGPMSSGKTLELIRKISINKIQDKKILVVKHNIDTRNIKNPKEINHVKVQSRIGIEYDAIAFQDATELLIYVRNLNKIAGYPDVIAIEEGQFFSQELRHVVDCFIEYGIDVIVTGLNQTFRGEPFGVMSDLISMSDEIILLQGVCAVCKKEATKTQRLINDKPAPYNSPTIIVGAEEGTERYECRCINCWEKPV